MDFTDDDLLTWELWLRREGTLPVSVQERLLKAARHTFELENELLETVD